MQPDYNPQGMTPQPPGYQPGYQQPMPMQQPMMQQQPGRHHGFSLIVLLIIFVLLTILFAGFAFWAFSERNDYKNNVDSKVEGAVNNAVEAANTAKEAEFAERSKSPFDEYHGPAAFGSITVKYPRTWSALVTEEDKGSTPIDGYFHPGVIPGVRSGTAYALRLEVVSSDYARELSKFDSDSKSGKVKVSSIELKGVTGARVDGQLSQENKGSTVLIPLRDKTLKITTESESFVRDFNDIILPNLTFSP